MYTLNYLSFGLPCLVSAISAGILLTKKGHTEQQAILALAFLAVALSCGCMHIYSLDICSSNPILDLCSIAFTLCCSPLLYLYVISLTEAKGIRPKHFIVLLPATIVVMLNIIADCMLGWEGTESFLFSSSYSKISIYDYSGVKLFKLAVDSNLFRLTNFVQTLTIIILWRREMHKYCLKEAEYFSDRGSNFISYEWHLDLAATTLNISLILTCTVPFAIYRHYPWVMAAIAVMFCFSLVLILYAGLKMVNSAKTLEEKLDETASIPIAQDETEDQSQSVNTSGKKKFMRRIEDGLRTFITEKGYLNPNITVEELVTALKTNRMYLSETIKEDYNESFSEFINGLRIKYSMDLISHMYETGKAMKTIAIESGYNSFANFYRNFVKVAGCSPTEWARRNKKSPLGKSA